MTWIDGLTCSVLRDGDAVAEVVLHNPYWSWTANTPFGVGVGNKRTKTAAKLAAERAIRTMRGEEEE